MSGLRATAAVATALGLAWGLPLEAASVERFRYQPDPGAVPQTEALGATPCVGGMAGIYPCNKVDLMAFLPNGQIGGGNASDIWGWTDPLTQKEYALLGRTNGTSFVDITDPANPVYLGNLPSHTGTSSWRELKTYANHAYVVSDQNGAHGMQIFDLTQLRAVTAPPAVTFTETAHYAGFGRCHDMVLNEETGYGYCVGSDTCSGGAHMMSLANPEAPAFVGCDAADGYTHDAQCVIYRGPDAQWFGHEVCFNSNTDTLTIMDVTNKSAPLRISRTTYAGVGYTHQGWLTEDHVHFLLDDELDEQDFGHNTYTYIWNLADLDAPVLMGHYTGPTAAIDHNQFIKGAYSYQADYQAGLRILDISQIASGSLTEYGYFDTYPSGNNASFAAAWGNYPFFESGTVIVSSIGEGLFVLRPEAPPDFSLQLGSATLEACSPGAASTSVSVGSLGGYAGTVTLSGTGLPAGTTPAFDPNPVAAPSSSQLTLTVAGTPAGSYGLGVQGADGPLVHGQNATLLVADTLPPAPPLSLPADGAVNQPLRPTFSWVPPPQAASYVLEIAIDPAFAAIVLQTPPITATTYTPTVDLLPNLVHFWRVRGANGCGPGSDSAIRSFTTGPAVVPGISIGDVSAPEDPPEAPERHPSSISFPVTLAAFTSQTVTVDYSVAGGTATAGLDFVPTSGTLTFPPNITSQPISVSILDDLLDEPDETLTATLSAPANGTLADGQATGTILDDDPPPDMTLADASVFEGNVGSRPLAFTPTLSIPSGKTVTVDYATGGGTATPGADYIPAAGTLTFAPGSTAASVDVAVLGDLLSEADETLTLTLGNGVDVTLPTAPAQGLIREDDPVAAPSGHELVHGSAVSAALAAGPGPLGHHELYRIAVPPRSSVEVVADALTGDVAPLVLQRVAADGSTVVQSATGLGLRWENPTAAVAGAERIRVASGGCTADCDAADRYRLRAVETTVSAARFNNSATQVTLLLLQNTTEEPISGNVWLWSAAGTLLGQQAVSLGPHGVLSLDTSGVPGAAGQSGSITVSHTGPYGGIAGKAVAVEPATGFSFDTPVIPRAR